jgi:hypothetical protein
MHRSPHDLTALSNLKMNARKLHPLIDNQSTSSTLTRIHPSGTVIRPSR